MNNEVFEQAFVIIQNRRNTAFAENEKRIEEINQKIPEIREVNETIFNMGKELISMFSENKDKDAENMIERLKQHNIGAQTMLKQMLVRHGYPADYLDIHYTCPKCNDTGYNGSVYCECLKKLCGKITADNLNKKANLKLSSFDTFSLSYYGGEAYENMKKIFNYTQQYAYNFSIGSDNILMFGGTGLGKTHLSLAIANEVLQKGYAVVYDSVINILRNTEKEHFSYGHSSEVIDNIMDTDLLILDDLGTEYQTQFYNSVIYNIINTRINRKLPTIISTNLDHEELMDRYEPRVASRIMTSYKMLPFFGKDVRLIIQKQQKQKNI